ncbi:MAG: cytochrome B6 [Waddliaceae bacterium]|nr:cytochrome B6 [Waddliaceae bacterium]
MPRYRNSLNIDSKSNDNQVSRRSFLALLGVAAGLGVAQLAGGALLGFLYPNALKTPPSVFSLGRPEEVLAKEGKLFIQKYKVFVEVKSGKLRCQTAVCTHLGCTVNAVETGYACPCHGSTYDLVGDNVSGPAPRPLVFFQAYKGASGEILVDKSRQIHEASEAWYVPVA